MTRCPNRTASPRALLTCAWACGLMAMLSCSRAEVAGTRHGAGRSFTDSTATSGSGALAAVNVTQLLAEVRRPGARATLVNVWASWCGPCRQEFPELVRLERAYRERGLRVMFVSTDFDSADARTFLASQGVDYRSYFKIGDDASFIDGLSPEWSGALPGTFVYDSGGQLTDFWEGRADYARFERAALDAMKGAATQPKETGS